MGKLKSFQSFDEKEKYFSNTSYVRIDTKAQFDEWFEFYTSDIKEAKKTDFIYRGMGDASYKLYTSAQRIWIENDMQDWAKGKFLRFVYDMINEAKRYPLIEKVFDIYEYSNSQREFPILSILQHYWAPTPLMDWTYNINVALFFATENIKAGNGITELDDYFSIYRINKGNYRDEFLNIRDFSFGNSSSFESFLTWGDQDSNTNNNNNSIFYISDFDEGNTNGSTPNALIKIVDQKPYTSIYNQNIIPQEGLFIFNPYSEKTIDDAFNVDLKNDGWNLSLTPFSCFNIKKDLADYVRRHIKENYSINKAFIYPRLYDDAEEIKNLVLNKYSK